MFEFKGTNKKPLRISLESIIYLQADDNYVDIIVLSNKEDIKTITFRATISSMERQLIHENHFKRTHRSFMINLHYLHEFSEKGAVTLMAEKSFYEIPVSGKYQKSLIESLN